MLPPHKSSFSSVRPLAAYSEASQLVCCLNTAATLQVPSTTLNFQTLEGFERVNEQFAHLGAHFAGAIALEPSNPLFYSSSGSLVLMPISDSAGITVYFDHPVQRVCTWVRTVRPVLLTAYDRDGNQLEQVSTPWEQAYTEEGFLKTPLTLQRLELSCQNIARVTLHCYAPFTLTGFDFGKALVS